MGTRNRKAGHDWERELVKMLRNTGVHPYVVTCRSTNRMRDGQGIDLCNAEESVQGRMLDDLQAKTTTKVPDFVKLLEGIKQHDTLDQRMPAVLWRRTGKSSSGKLFRTQGFYAMCYLEDYLKLLQAREALKALEPLLPALGDLLGHDDEFTTIKSRLKELQLI
jgi:hypothetical protein